MPLSLSALRAPPQSPVSVSCSQIDFSAGATGALRGMSAAFAAVTETIAIAATPVIDPQNRCIPKRLIPSPRFLTCSSCDCELLTTRRELGERGEMFLVHLRIEQRPLLGRLQTRRRVRRERLIFAVRACRL